MDFLVLGPLEIRREGEPVDVRGGKRRALLALLILHANEVIRTDRLVDELWGERPPANASAALQNHVSRLRKDLGGEVLVTRPWGYVLRADADAIDLHRFESLVAEARTLPAHERRERLHEALALWRGPALADVASEPALMTEIARLEELRLSALEQRIDTDLELGGDSGLVAELETLVATYPLRERLRGQLILALYRAGRQAEALEAYRETRRVLVEELGIEPRPELRELEQAILRQDPALVVAPAPPAPGEPKPYSRWRWPRSPLAITAALLVLGAGGAAAALLVGAGGPNEGQAARPTSSAPARVPLTATKSEHERIAATTARQHERPRRRNKRGTSTGKATTAPTTTTHEQHRRPPAPPTGPTRTSTAQKTATETTAPNQTTTTTQKRPAPVTIADDFDDGVRNVSIWHAVVTGTNVDLAEHGSLEIGIGAGAEPGGQYNMVDGHYGTQCKFPGDFDARVDYRLLAWPEQSGVYLALNAFFANALVERWSQSAEEAGVDPLEVYGSWIKPQFRVVNTNDQQGSLRLRRKNNVVTTYYLAAGEWRKIDSARSPGDAVLGIQLSANQGISVAKTVRVAFDNFKVVATEPVC